ncbi:hypothetical protein BDV38DRAFT_68353 [Aspergillus pseudotamarii]|uniref:Uncharacterized protein n=1 Tax=Aspergillus pseudotamarii TaxID=132259 RepID=A0A5N6SXG2_ASPPS|nr:uncharacterized protein BDV38DRAFT_68353 [Aspergillus pseudotamarii]KAE8138597.1 hypothetical protein BDV38DRAFT_68353 [Aspergillus pseudotamarii]
MISSSSDQLLASVCLSTPGAATVRYRNPQCGVVSTLVLGYEYKLRFLRKGYISLYYFTPYSPTRAEAGWDLSVSSHQYGPVYVETRTLKNRLYIKFNSNPDVDNGPRHMAGKLGLERRETINDR